MIIDNIGRPTWCKACWGSVRELCFIFVVRFTRLWRIGAFGLVLLGCSNESNGEKEKRESNACTDNSPISGLGELNDPYRICAVGQLRRIGNELDQAGHYLIDRDLDWNDYAGDPFQIGHFEGTLDGGGHRLFNLSLTSVDGKGGLIRRLEGATIQNLSVFGASATAGEFGAVIAAEAWGLDEIRIRDVILEDVQVVSGRFGAAVVASASGTLRLERVVVKSATITADGDQARAGGLVASTTSPGATISDCSMDGSVRGTEYAGGILGHCGGDCILEESTSSATVESDTRAGGLVGSMAGEMSNCSASGSVRGHNAGGLIGILHGTVVDSFSTGAVRGSRAGGLVGAALGVLSQPEIRRSFATGSVQGVSAAGGLLGWADPFEGVTVRDCYATGLVTAMNSSLTTNDAGGLVGELLGPSIVERCYSSSPKVSGQFAGGLVGSMRISATLRDSFASTEVAGSSLGGVLGDANTLSPTPIDRVYWDESLGLVSVCIGGTPSNQPASCLGLNIDGISPQVFQSMTEPPLDMWDFVNVWQAKAGEFPRLRSVP